MVGGVRRVDWGRCGDRGRHRHAGRENRARGGSPCDNCGARARLARAHSQGSSAHGACFPPALFICLPGAEFYPHKCVPFQRERWKWAAAGGAKAGDKVWCPALPAAPSATALALSDILVLQRCRVVELVMILCCGGACTGAPTSGKYVCRCVWRGGRARLCNALISVSVWLTGS